MSLSPSLYISKNISEVETLHQFCTDKGVVLTANSGIRFEFIPQDINPTGDIYFFGSKNAFHYFKKLNIPTDNKLIAVIGKSTKQFIETNNIKVDFYGENAGNPKDIAHEFMLFTKQKKVSFFISNKSKRSISSFLPSGQVEEFVIYQTIEKTETYDQQFTHYVFTSPSNVNSFLEKNKIPENSIVVAWGNTTREELEKNKILVKHTLSQSTQDELIELLGSIL